MPTITVLSDGSRTAIPVDAGQSASGWRVEVTGTIRCQLNGLQYDALNVFDPVEPTSSARPHAYLAWWPRQPEVELADTGSHHYVFRFPTIAAGVSPTVGVDVDRFVRDLLVTPSEVRQSLSGRFAVSALPPSAAATPLWSIGAVSVPALLLTGGVTWVIRRRMANPTLDYDLQAQLERIRRKACAARNAMRREDRRLVPVSSRLDTLETTAALIAKQAHKLRGALALQDRQALEKQIERLQGKKNSDPAQTEIDRTLREKQKTLAAVVELEESARVCSARLARIEAVVESTLASLHTVRAGTPQTASTDAVCQALDSEVRALREAASPARVEDLVAGSRKWDSHQ